ncbi:MAG: HAD family hydrolase [Oscillospiraceae bacterium]|nr:HAD family hydrolase [Oscillospiraceae bacterium]
MFNDRSAPREQNLGVFRFLNTSLSAWKDSFMIKAIIFDIDNTLYDYDSANADAMKALEKYTYDNLGWDKAETRTRIKTAYSRIQNEIGQKAAIHNRLIRFQRVLEANGLPLHPYALEMHNLYWDTLIDSARVFDGVDKALAQLKNAGFVLGIGTNMTADIQFQKLTRFGLLQYFDFIVSSEEADCEKPDKNLFLKCAIKAGYDPSSCLYVGDSLIHDIVAADDAGFQVLWFRPGKTQLEEGAALPVDHNEYVYTGGDSYPSFSDFNLLPSIIEKLISDPQESDQ